MADQARAILYLRVSTEDQATDGSSLAAQENALQVIAKARNWSVVDVTVDAGASGKSLDRRGMRAALAVLASSGADILAATALDRLSRSVRDVATLAELSAGQGWKMFTVSGEVDTTTAMGEAFTNIAATFAQLERRLIGDRTRAGMAQRKRENPSVHLGRRTALPADLIARIRALSAGGSSDSAIARLLTSSGVPTATGGVRWWPSAVASARRVNPSPPPVRTPRAS